MKSTFKIIKKTIKYFFIAIIGVILLFKLIDNPGDSYKILILTGIFWCGITLNNINENIIEIKENIQKIEDHTEDIKIDVDEEMTKRYPNRHDIDFLGDDE